MTRAAAGGGPISITPVYVADLLVDLPDVHMDVWVPSASHPVAQSRGRLVRAFRGALAAGHG